MPRARTILQSEFPYNISARCINREWFHLPMDTVWNIFCEQLAETCQKYELKIHSFVLMSNHFHLIASTPQANISQCMWHFMRSTSFRLTRSGNRINETFAGRHYKCILHEPNYYLNAYKYNYRNPIAAGVCERAEGYPYSTLRVVTGLAPSRFPMAEDTTFICDPFGTLNWINTTPDKKRIDAVKFGLKHQYFKSKKCPINKKLVLSANDLL